MHDGDIVDDILVDDDIAWDYRLVPVTQEEDISSLIRWLHRTTTRVRSIPENDDKRRLRVSEGDEEAPEGERTGDDKEEVDDLHDRLGV